MLRIRQFERPVVKRYLSITTASYILLVLLITTLGVGLRAYAIPRLPIEPDERVYLISALQYSTFIREGQWKMLSWYDFNSQHPPLNKILFGAALLTRPPLQTLWDKDFYNGPAMSKVPAAPWGITARSVSVIFGGLTTLILTAANPIAGLFYATHTRAIEFNTYITLEALPTLASLLSALCYLRWLRRVDQEPQPGIKNDIWLGFSAAFLGMAAASKYNYAVVGIAILIHFSSRLLLKKNRPADLWKLIAWGALALVMFYLFDPFIWKHPIARLLDSLAFHIDYSQSEKARAGEYPFYQPLVWLSAPATTFSILQQKSGSYLIQPDTIIGLLALAGLPRLLKRQPLFFAWLVIGLCVLMIWSTKWPQYIMTVMVPVSMSAAMSTGWLFDWLKNGLLTRQDHL